MKYCPSCQTTYTDDALRFCLQDGTPLAEVANSDSQSPTDAFDNAETQVTRREPIRVELPGIENYRREPVREEPVTVNYSAPKRSNTALIVLLTALITLLLFGGGIGAWLFLRNGKNETARAINKNAANQNVYPKNDAKNSRAEVSPSPFDSPESSTPSPAPSAAASLNFSSEKVKREVSDKISSWVSATESLDTNALISYYADTVDYYNKNNSSAAYIKGDKQRAFSKFDNVEMNISNLRVTPDTSGDKATAVFDKEWTFEGEDSYSSGKVQSQLQLKKINGQWLITGEKDLKIYYIDK